MSCYICNALDAQANACTSYIEVSCSSFVDLSVDDLGMLTTALVSAFLLAFSLRLLFDFVYKRT